MKIERFCVEMLSRMLGVVGADYSIVCSVVNVVFTTKQDETVIISGTVSVTGNCSDCNSSDVFLQIKLLWCIHTCAVLGWDGREIVVASDRS